MLRLDHLATLQTVLRRGSFADAARELGYTASAVSQQIGALERNTGLALFEREAKSIRPTTAAHHLMESSRTLLADADALWEEIRRLATGQSGRVRLGAFATA